MDTDDLLTWRIWVTRGKMLICATLKYEERSLQYQHVVTLKTKSKRSKATKPAIVLFINALFGTS